MYILLSKNSIFYKNIFENIFFYGFNIPFSTATWQYKTITIIGMLTYDMDPSGSKDHDRFLLEFFYKKTLYVFHYE